MRSDQANHCSDWQKEDQRSAALEQRSNSSLEIIGEWGGVLPRILQVSQGDVTFGPGPTPAQAGRQAGAVAAGGDERERPWKLIRFRYRHRLARLSVDGTRASGPGRKARSACR